MGIKDDKIRAAAIADLMAGEQPAVVAAKYGLDPAKVRVWKQRFVTDAVTETPTVTPPQRPALIQQQLDIGAIVLDLLRAKLEASAAIARAAQNPEWLAAQSAAELATLGQYLDQSAFALGDRLAKRPSDASGDTPGDARDPSDG